MSLFGNYGVSANNNIPGWATRLRSSAATVPPTPSPNFPQSASPTNDVFNYTLNALRQTASPTTPQTTSHHASWFQPMALAESAQEVVNLPQAKVIGPETLAAGQYQVITDRGTLTFDRSASHTQPFANARVLWEGGGTSGDVVPVTMTPAEKKTLYKYMKQCLLNQQAATQPMAVDGQSLS